MTSSQGFVAWLFSAAGAGWLLGIVSLIGLIVTLVYRFRPPQLQLREIRRTSLVHISSGVRGAVKVQFQGTPIQTLAESEYEMRNTGSDTIAHPAFTLRFPSSTRVLAISTDGGGFPSTMNIPDERTSVARVDLPYLNAFRHHGQTVTVAILCDGSAEFVDAVGGGAGWSIKTRKLPSVADTQRLMIRTLAASLVILPAVNFAYYRLAPTLEAASPEALPYLLVFLIGLLAWLAFMVHVVIRAFRMGALKM